jgi:pimeloyl-ACP methyl ester carboxylesterase
MQLAIRHPKSVRKLALLSGAYSFDGLHDAFKPMVPTMTAAMFDGTPLRSSYDSLSPHPEKFPVLVERLKKLDMTPYNWEKDYEKIKHPMLLVFGDADVVTVAHAREMYAKLGGTVMGDMAPLPPVQLAILPATTHIGVVYRLNWIIPMIQEFYAGKSMGNPFGL